MSKSQAELRQACSVAHIAEVFQNATIAEFQTGSQWYDNALLWCCEQSIIHNSTPIIVAGIVAALSPGLAWGVNKRCAIRVLEGHTTGLPAYPKAITKALGIKAGERPIWTPPLKCASFLQNILGCEHSVTIDRHAIAIALGRVPGKREYTGMRETTYAHLADLYRATAYHLAVMPSVVQAVTWCVWRRVVGGRASAFAQLDDKHEGYRF